MNRLPEIVLFDRVSDGHHGNHKGSLGRMHGSVSPPKTFLVGITIAVSVLLLTYEQSMFSTWQGKPLSFLAGIGMEFLFHGSVLLLILATQLRQIVIVYIILLISCIINAVLNSLYQIELPYGDLFRNHWGNFGLWLCCGIACYRFPFRWASPIALISSILLIGTNEGNHFFMAGGVDQSMPFLVATGGEAILCVLGWLQRSRAMLFLELHKVQAQLHLQIQRTEEFATTRERTRIARDIHDVLAHSLTILSIQVQAARQLVSKDPERLAVKLEEMALLLRESIAESRRVVGLLRALPTADNGIEAALQIHLKRFEEQSGINCYFGQRGISRSLADEYRTTLLYALQEALTNAHRHGQAQAIWVSLSWEEDKVMLQIYDNGAIQEKQMSVLSHPHGHHGLQGMRERAAAMGGGLLTEVLAEGGFKVTLELPFP